MTDPAYVKDFKKYIRPSDTSRDIKEAKQEVEAMANEFYGPSARAVVILQAVQVELQLDRAIESIMRSDLSATLKAKVFDFEGAIGTFAAKIAIADAFGIFGPQTKHDLELIRMLRNGFAHCTRPMTFSTAQVAAVCKHLQVPEIPGIGMTPRRLLKAMGYDRPNLQDPKSRYVSACWSIARLLAEFVADKKRPKLKTSKLP